MTIPHLHFKWIYRLVGMKRLRIVTEIIPLKFLVDLKLIFEISLT